MKLDAVKILFVLLAAAAAVLPAAPARAADTYELAPGDLLEVRVEGEQELTGPRRVRPDGRLDLPLVGSVVAAGRTPAAVAATLEEELRTYLRRPMVSIAVAEANPTPVTVYVVGEVEEPGPVPLPQGARLLDALGGAGGLLPMADLGAVEMERDGDLMRVDLEQIFQQGGALPNPAVHDGELVRVPRAREKYVYVLGEVFRPGRVLNHHEPVPLTLTEALTLAGGPTAEARLAGITVLRTDEHGQRRNLDWNLRKSLKGSRDEELELRPGDIVFAPAKRGVRFRRGFGNIFPFLGEVTRSAAAGAAIQ